LRCERMWWVETERGRCPSFTIRWPAERRVTLRRRPRRRCARTLATLPPAARDCPPPRDCRPAGCHARSARRVEASREGRISRGSQRQRRLGRTSPPLRRLQPERGVHGDHLKASSCSSTSSAFRTAGITHHPRSPRAAVRLPCEEAFRGLTATPRCLGRRRLSLRQTVSSAACPDAAEPRYGCYSHRSSRQSSQAHPTSHQALWRLSAVQTGRDASGRAALANVMNGVGMCRASVTLVRL
jgi:hypothetical protein